MVTKLAEEQRGIILVTGTTGSGKSTTLAAMIDHINRTRAHHIVTLEDPIEYLHQDKRSIVNQREVGSDTESFARAMRRVLRQDPDVILIGEMRDEETVRTALSAAETGHLVLSTVHTLDATETINRIIDFFPPHLQHQARVMLASTLKGAIAQRLVPDINGDGRVPASEVLVVTGRVQDLILNPEETGKITEVIAEGEYYGMRTFDQSLLGYVMEGKVTEEVALETPRSPHDFKLMLAAGGQRASGIEQLEQPQRAGGRRPPRSPAGRGDPHRSKRHNPIGRSVGRAGEPLRHRSAQPRPAPAAPAADSGWRASCRRQEAGRRPGSDACSRSPVAWRPAGERRPSERAGRSASTRDAPSTRRRSTSRRRRADSRATRRRRRSAAASVPAPPLPAPVQRAYASGKTVVLLVVRDGGIDDALVAPRSAG